MCVRACVVTDVHGIILLENSRTKSELKWPVSSGAVKGVRHAGVTEAGVGRGWR